MNETGNIEKYAEYINSLNLVFDKEPEEYGYENPVILLMDAVLSINRQYNKFVLPRLEYFTQKFSNINTLHKLNNLIIEKGINNFEDVWNYNHPKRVEILQDLTLFFIDYKNKNSIKDDLEGMKHWAKNVDVNSKRMLPVNGIGFATSLYIRKMLGVDTVKPDIHIKKSIYEGIGKKMSEKETVLFIEKVAHKMNITATALDYAIWEYYSIK